MTGVRNMKYGRLIHVQCLVLGLMTGAAGAGPNDQLVILDVTVVGNTLAIHGLNLGGGTPMVTLDGDIVAVETGTNGAGTQITATFAPPLPPPGSYLLTVLRDEGGSIGRTLSKKVLGTFNITIGAVGPTGPPGAVGPVGPHGPAGGSGTGRSAGSRRRRRTGATARTPRTTESDGQLRFGRHGGWSAGPGRRQTEPCGHHGCG